MPTTIDLRSDTVTHPSPAMRAAMQTAPLGDDVFGDDPTVNRLEALAAARVGKPAAVFVPSGTMGNLCALLAHCGRGDEAIIGDESHIYHYEAGGASVLGGIPYHTVPTLPDGTLPLETLAAAIRPDDQHAARSGVICLENTHNRCGGTVLNLAYMAEVRTLAQAHGLPLHLDGARVFNAAVALGVDVAQITQHVDSVMFCLSKGLAAPVGSILAGETACIARARRARKMLGGGMRQAGVLAAAGIIALDEMVDRLAEDHQHARNLAEGLAQIPGIAIDLARVQTDIVIFTLHNAPLSATELQRTLAEQGVLLTGMGPGRLRAVTHYGIAGDDIEIALDRIQHALAS